MTIDCNEKELQAMAEMHKGNREEGARLQEEFITEFRRSEEHTSELQSQR